MARNRCDWWLFERGNGKSLSVNEGTVLTSFGTVSFSRTPPDGVGWLVRKEELRG